MLGQFQGDSLAECLWKTVRNMFRGPSDGWNITTLKGCTDLAKRIVTSQSNANRQQYVPKDNRQATNVENRQAAPIQQGESSIPQPPAAGKRECFTCIFNAQECDKSDENLVHNKTIDDLSEKGKQIYKRYVAGRNKQAKGKGKNGK